MIAIVKFAGEGDPFSVRRPARLIVGFVVIGNLSQSSAAICVDYPHVAVAVLVIFLAGAIRDEGDALAVGRPLGIAVVPVVAMRNRSRFAGLHIDDPKMGAPIVEPSRIVEFVGNMFVVSNVAASARVNLKRSVTWPDTAHHDQTGSIRRPAKEADTVFKIRDALRFAAVHR